MALNSSQKRRNNATASTVRLEGRKNFDRNMTNGKPSSTLKWRELVLKYVLMPVKSWNYMHMTTKAMNWRQERGRCCRDIKPYISERELILEAPKTDVDVLRNVPHDLKILFYEEQCHCALISSSWQQTPNANNWLAWPHMLPLAYPQARNWDIRKQQSTTARGRTTWNL